MISRAKLRGRKLDEDCKRACTSTNELDAIKNKTHKTGGKKMKAKELIELLQKYDDETEVKICDSRLPVYEPIEISDFADEEDGVLIIEGE